MMHDYNFGTIVPERQQKPVLRRLQLPALLLLLAGASAVYLAMEDSPPRGPREPGGVVPKSSPVTITLALPPASSPAEGQRVAASPDGAEAPEDTQAKIGAESPAGAPPRHAPSMLPPGRKETRLSDHSIRPTPAPPGEEGPTAPGQAGAVSSSEDKWLQHDITAGDTLARIFSSMELSPRLLHDIVNSSKQARRLAHIKPGQQIRVRINARNEFRELVHQISPLRRLQVISTDDGFETRVIDQPAEHRLAHAAGIINSSLFLSAQQAGLSDAKTMELANIFGWDIDFALEIRAGDQFTVIYQEDYLDGKKLGDGPILAAEFVNRGKIYRAIRYADGSGHADYYTPEGQSVRKAFLRTPVKFARISSTFSLGRKHPILNRIRAHKGVDYAAPTGTPVRASGDGRVVFRGRKGGYGKAVIIEHGGGISTLYGHLSNFSRRVRKGTRVTQGQVIGYVGQTGLATGPHLHYEFRLNGVHRNPLTVKLPAAKPIDRGSKADFEHQTRPLIARLEALSRTMLAKAQATPTGKNVQ